jgi:glycosyltransferase involved in cell wall biosynthesis
MVEPLVSVIVCVRNGERYIQEALDSIAHQTFADFEVVVIDDGSEDRSAQIAERHPLSPRVAAQQPRGLAAALNHGMDLVRGQRISFLDCDDVWPEDRLRQLNAALERNEITDGVFGKVVNTDERLAPIAPPLLARMPTAMLIRAASARRVGEFRTDVAHGANVDWISRATRIGLKFDAVGEVVLMRRIHDANLGVRDRTNARHDLLRVIRDHRERNRK